MKITSCSVAAKDSKNKRRYKAESNAMIAKAASVAVPFILAELRHMAVRSALSELDEIVANLVKKSFRAAVAGFIRLQDKIEEQQPSTRLTNFFRMLRRLPPHELDALPKHIEMRKNKDKDSWE